MSCYDWNDEVKSDPKKLSETSTFVLYNNKTDPVAIEELKRRITDPTRSVDYSRIEDAAPQLIPIALEQLEWFTNIAFMSLELQRKWLPVLVDRIPDGRFKYRCHRMMRLVIENSSDKKLIDKYLQSVMRQTSGGSFARFKEHINRSSDSFEDKYWGQMTDKSKSWLLLKENLSSRYKPKALIAYLRRHENFHIKAQLKWDHLRCVPPAYLVAIRSYIAYNQFVGDNPVTPEEFTKKMFVYLIRVKDSYKRDQVKYAIDQYTTWYNNTVVNNAQVEVTNGTQSA
jgi:hypothetical protein